MLLAYTIWFKKEGFFVEKEAKIKTIDKDLDTKLVGGGLYTTEDVSQTTYF